LIAMGIAITVIGATGGAAVGWYGTFLVRGRASGDHGVTGVAVGVCLLLLFLLGLRWLWLRLGERPSREARAPVASEELSSVNLWEVHPPQAQDAEQQGHAAASHSR
jgi:hypothetical protein